MVQLHLLSGDLLRNVTVPVVMAILEGKDLMGASRVTSCVLHKVSVKKRLPKIVNLAELVELSASWSCVSPHYRIRLVVSTRCIAFLASPWANSSCMQVYGSFLCALSRTSHGRANWLRTNIIFTPCTHISASWCAPLFGPTHAPPVAMVEIWTLWTIWTSDINRYHSLSNSGRFSLATMELFVPVLRLRPGMRLVLGFPAKPFWGPRLYN